MPSGSALVALVTSSSLPSPSAAPVAVADSARPSCGERCGRWWTLPPDAADSGAADSGAADGDAADKGGAESMNCL